MKKTLSLLLSVALAASLFACGTPITDSKVPQETNQPSDKSDEKVNIRIAALKGPTAMGMVKMMQDSDLKSSVKEYSFTLAGAPDEITGGIIKGDFDVAAVPTNLASVLYNKSEGKIQIAALNTLGVLYVIENGDSIKAVSDLKGKTIYSTGKGSTPEFALNYILEKNGLKVGTDVSVEYKSEHAELAALLAADKAKIALLPQPFVTSVLTQNNKLRVALDMTKEWRTISPDSSLTMGCIIVNKAFAEKYSEALKAFLEKYKASVEFVTKVENADQAAQLIEKYGIIKAAVAKKALPQCNIVYIDGADMEKTTSGFLNVLFNADPKSVGGKLPDEAFYYKQ